MPRKSQGWITFQASADERRILDDYCQRSQRSKTDILRDLIRSLELRSAEYQTQELISDEFKHEKLIHDRLQPHTKFAISARNLLCSTVTKIISDGVNAELTLTASPGVEIIAIVTLASVKRLNLTQGKEVYAVIKANNVMIAAATPSEAENPQ